MDEEKDLAQEKRQIAKEEYEIEVLELNKDSAPIAVTSIVRNEFEQDEEIVRTYEINIPFGEDSIMIATINEEGKLIPNESLLENDRYNEEEKKMLKDLFDRLKLERDRVDLEGIEKQLELAKEKMPEPEENADKMEQERQEDDEKDKTDEEPRDDEEERETEQNVTEVDDTAEKEEIAKKYSDGNSKNIVHIDPKHKKITTDKSLDGLVNWAKNRSDIFVVVDRTGQIQTVLEKKGTKYEEIKEEVDKDMQQTQGNMPDVTVHIVGKNNEVKDKKPLKIYRLNKDEAFAIVRNDEWEEFETLYCRKIPGKEEFFGKTVPEKSGKNMEQSAYEGRAFMDSDRTSGMDLSRKKDELDDTKQRREESGAPTAKPGEVITQTPEQNKLDEKLRIEDDLFKKLGITEQAMYNTIPGLFEYRKHELEDQISQKAEEIQKKISEDPKLRYEDLLQEAADAIEKENNEREEGGRTPADKDSRRNTGW